MHSAIYISIFSMTVDIFSWDKNVFKTRWILKSKVFFSAYLLIFFFLIVHVFLAYRRTCQNSKHQWLTNNDVGVRSFNLKFVSAWPWPKTWKIKQFYFRKIAYLKLVNGLPVRFLEKAGLGFDFIKTVLGL